MRAKGVVLVVTAIVLIIVYAYGLFINPSMKIFGIEIALLLTRVTVFIFVLIVSIILGYIGYLWSSRESTKSLEEYVSEYRRESSIIEERE